MKKIIITILILTITFTAVLEQPQRVDAFFEWIPAITLLGVTIPPVALAAAAGVLVASGIVFATNEDARNGAYAYFSSEATRVGANMATMAAAIGGFTQSAGSNIVKVSSSLWDSIYDYTTSFTTDGMTSYTPPYRYDDISGTSVSNDGTITIEKVGLDLTESQTIISQDGTLVFHINISTDDYMQWVLSASTCTLNGVNLARIGASSLLLWNGSVNSQNNNIRDNHSTFLQKIVSIGTVVQYWGYFSTNVSLAQAWHMITSFEAIQVVGAPTQTINATNSVAATQAWATTQDQVGDRSVAVPDSLAGVNSQALATATTDAMGLTIPDTIVIPYDMPDINGLTLPQLITTKFPFSIPWDLVNAVKLLNAPVEVPVFTIPFKITRFGINESVVIDMSQFELLAKLARFMFLLIFMFSMVLVTKKIVGGEG